jgi:hypothetical protein
VEEIDRGESAYGMAGRLGLVEVRRNRTGISDLLDQP